MPLINSSFKRKSGFRESYKLILVFEGKDTEPLYFEALKAYIQNTRVEVEIIDPKEFGVKENDSAAQYRLQCLDAYKKKHKPQKDDELWLIIDRDKQNQTEKQLSETAQLCEQKRYFLAVSNPTFEFWLVLHFENPDNYTETEKQERFNNVKINKSRRFLENLLTKYLGGYNKSSFNTEKLMPLTETALENAKKLPLPESDRWHKELGTAVYFLIEKIITK